MKAMVAREGTAPSTSGCRPDVMLFHHRAFAGHQRDCLAASLGFAPRPSGSKPGMLRVTPRGNEWARRAKAPSEGWWPAGVTRPVLRIKSPLHHFNACRPKCTRRAEARRAKSGARVGAISPSVGLAFIQGRTGFPPRRTDVHPRSNQLPSTLD